MPVSWFDSEYRKAYPKGKVQGVFDREACEYGAIMLCMATVLQIASPNAIRRIQRVQIVTIA